MDPVSAVLINKALDGLSMRMEAISQNVANAQSPGYRPLRVSFEEALRSAKASGPDAVSQVEPTIERLPTDELQGEQRIDMELAQASATSARYAALIDIMNRQMQLSRSILRGGQA